MFVKKDLRKIPIILQDAMITTPPPAPPLATTPDNNNNNNNNNNNKNEQKQEEKEPLTELRLARRPTEFKNGSIHDILCQPKYIPAMRNLLSISLYDCQIRTIDGIGFFATSIQDVIGETTTAHLGAGHGRMKDADGVVCPNLQELNLGRNPIKSLPAELGLFSKSLKSLWLDDCEIEGPLPQCLYELDNLEMLRLSNNRITELKDDDDDDDDEMMEGDIDEFVRRSGLNASNWKKLQVLCLDGNNIEKLPKSFIHLTKLKSLLLRKNKIKKLPEGVPGSAHTNLTLFHISSNELKTLPISLRECSVLETMYANGNQIDSLPDDLFRSSTSDGSSCSSLQNLKLVNLSNNQIKFLPKSFVERFGTPNDEGICDKDSSCTISLEQNPLLL